MGISSTISCYILKNDNERKQSGLYSFQKGETVSTKQKKVFSPNVLKQWHENFKKLVLFKEKYGDCDVPYLWGEDVAFSKWIGIQRKAKNKLPVDLKESLISIGFDFSGAKFNWEEKYEELLQFKKENGHIFLPLDDKKYIDLKDWLSLQILNKDYLVDERFNKLNSLGVVWENKTLRDNKWEAMFEKLDEFKKLNGHCIVPQNWAENPQLSNWVCVQRRTAASGKMTREREKKLNKIGFIWSFREIYDNQWEHHYKLLQQFKKQYGHCKAPGSFKELASWIDRQRTLKKNGKLSEQKEKRLTNLGFVWNFIAENEKKWNEKYQLLSNFKKQHGHCFVPINWKENPSLGNWVATQRRLEASGKLDPDKKAILNKTGFIWSNEALNKLNEQYNNQWEINYKKLITYHKKHKTLQVSLKIDPGLQRWTSLQRRLYKLDRLSKERVEKLDKIDFPWNTQQAYWFKMYNELLNFKREFGHFKVPWGWKENPQLAPWIQRTKLNKHEIGAKKIILLDKIGFDWTRKKRVIKPWEEMYQKLKEFKENYGHTSVPVQWEKDEKLGKWVSRMRYEGKNLPEERRQLLNEINFNWGKQPVKEENISRKRVSA